MSVNLKLPYTAHELARALRGSLAKEQGNGSSKKWVVLEELRYGAGFSKTRTLSPAPYLAMLRRRKRDGQTEVRSRFGTGETEPIDEAIDRTVEELRDWRRTKDPADFRLDVFALCTWPSKNFLRRGYEIKIDKGDLKREFEEPAKRAPWLEIVNEFNLLTPPGLTSREEVEERAPECGLIEFDRELVVKGGFGTYTRPDSGLRVLKRPIKLPGSEPSWRLVASMLRSAR